MMELDYGNTENVVGFALNDAPAYGNVQVLRQTTPQTLICEVQVNRAVKTGEMLRVSDCVPPDDEDDDFEYDDEDTEDDGPVIIPAWAERPHWLEGYLDTIGQDDLDGSEDAD